MKKEFGLPLSRRVNFKTTLKRANLFQVSKINRRQLKLEPDQVLRVGIGGLGGGWEFFYARMGKDGRIFIPKAVLFAAHGKEENLVGLLVEITLEPT